MDVWVVWTEYGEDVNGVFSTIDKALKYLPKVCTRNHSHNDNDVCGTWQMTIDREN